MPVFPPSDGSAEEVLYHGPEITSMCPAVALGIEVAQSGRLNEETAQVIREVSARMTQLAKEERDVLLREWDKLIAAAKASRSAERGA